jgi:hypothetical protein
MAMRCAYALRLTSLGRFQDSPDRDSGMSLTKEPWLGPIF